MIRSGDCGQRTRELIARHYLGLMGKYIRRDDGRVYLSMDSADMFHNAVTLILQDSSMRALDTDEAIMEHIERRVRNVFSEIKKDHKQERRARYADDLQAMPAEAE